MRLVALVSLGLALSALAGCNTAPARSACSGSGAPAGCGMVCSDTSPCSAGLYCNTRSRCTADCSASLPCSGGASCGADGRCTTTAPMMDANVIGPRDTALVIPDVPPIDHNCASVMLGTTRVTPNIILIIDQSGSMGTTEFPAGSGVTRWDALESALLAMPSGILYTLQASARFGAIWYREPPLAACPGLTPVPCAFNNYATIAGQYHLLRAGGGTPTGLAISQVTGTLDTDFHIDPAQPTIYVLATDGEPNGCGSSDTTAGRLASVTAVQNAYARGIQTYVISVGDDTATSHLQMLANAGVGSSGAPDAPFWVASDTAGLNAALQTIIGSAVTCDVELMGMVDTARACDGTVTLAGNPLTCNDPNGWIVVDANHIRLQGSACDMLLSGATPLEATFPCGIVLL
jgi:hypothetical protein